MKFFYNKIVGTVFLCFIIARSALPAQETASLPIIDGVAALVGEHIILKSEVAQLVNMTAIQQQLNPTTEADLLLQLQRDVLQSMIDQKIILEMASIDSIMVDNKEVDRAMDQQIEMFINQAGSKDRAEERLGQPIKSFRREFWYDMKDRLISDRYQQTLINKISVSRQDVESFYNTYKDSLPVFPLTVKLRHLLVRVAAGVKSKAATKAFLDSLRSEIVSGASFAELANLYSQDPGSAAKGGSLGLVLRGALVPEFETVAFAQEVGTISDLVETAFGYHIIETEEKRGDRVRVRHILLIPDITEEDDSRAYRFALTLRDSATTLAEFKHRVKVYSADETTKDVGGDLGWVNPHNSPIPELSQVISLLEMGECSLPVKTEQGYHLFWVENIRPGGQPNLALHWPEIEDIALNHKRTIWYQDWITMARKNFYIQVSN